jgi:hypothetical protein
VSERRGLRAPPLAFVARPGVRGSGCPEALWYLLRLFWTQADGPEEHSTCDVSL